MENGMTMVGYQIIKFQFIERMSYKMILAIVK